MQWYNYYSWPITYSQAVIFSVYMLIGSRIIQRFESYINEDWNITIPSVKHVSGIVSTPIIFPNHCMHAGFEASQVLVHTSWLDLMWYLTRFK